MPPRRRRPRPALLTTSAPLRVLHVSPTGSDANPGTVTAPLRTPQLAVDRSLGGGVVELADGTYRGQRLRIMGGTDVTVRAATGARPVFDETGLTPTDGNSGVVEIHDGARITVSGLEITGYRTRSTAKVPIGPYVTGAAKSVALTRNHVHHLGNDNPTPGSFDTNTHGIAVYGRSAAASISGLTISDNEVDHLVLGASEAVVVNGNVDGWAVTDNRVHDNNNTGIDAIGYETTLAGAARYTDANRARNGIIARNTMTNIISRGNPSYLEDGEWCNCADGIYVDGGRSIRIENNSVTRADIGIEIAAEDPRGQTNDISVRANTVTGSAYVGLAIGGYGPRRGEAYGVTVRDNTLSGQQHAERRLPRGAAAVQGARDEPHGQPHHHDQPRQPRAREAGQGVRSPRPERRRHPRRKRLRRAGSDQRSVVLVGRQGSGRAHGLAEGLGARRSQHSNPPLRPSSSVGRQCDPGRCRPGVS